MKMSEVTWVEQPETAAPDGAKPFVALRPAKGGQEFWVELVTDSDVGPEDLDFQPASARAETQRGPQ
jgi:hypothetical protein